MPTEDELIAHSSFLKQVIGRLVADSHLVDDVVQETLLAACRTRPRSRASIRSWLKTVALRLVYRRTVAEERRRSLERDAARGESEQESEVPNDPDSTKRAVARAVLGLSEPYRTVIFLRFIRGESPKQIGKRLDRSTNTVHSQIRRGIERLRVTLDNEFGDRSSWCVALLALDFGRREVGPMAISWTRALFILGLIGSVPLTLMLLASGNRGRELDTPSTRDLASDQAAGLETKRTSVLTNREPVPASDSAVVAGPANVAGRVEIEVVDTTGRPVTDASIYVFKYSDSQTLPVAGFWRRHTETNEQGRASLQTADLPSGRPAAASDDIERVSLQVLAKLHVASDPVHVDLARARGLLELRIELDGPDLEVRGQVSDAKGIPIAGARVTVGTTYAEPRFESGHLVTSEPMTRLTDDEGVFELRNLPSGRHPIRIGAIGFTEHIGWLAGAAGETVETKIELQRAAVLVGRATRIDGAALANALVWIEPRPQDVAFAVHPVTANEDGFFRIESIPAGRHIVWARDPDSPDQVARAELEFAGGEETEWYPGVEEVEGLALRFVDESGAPFEGLALRIESGDPTLVWVRFAETDEQGRAVVYDCPDVPISIDVFSSSMALYGYGMPIYAQSGLRTAFAEQEFVLANLRLASLFGFVADHLDVPLDGVSLFVRDTERSHARPVEIDPSSGRFAIPELAPGTYELVVQSRVHGTWSFGEYAISGDDIDLGTLRTPRLAELNIRWNWTERLPWELLKLEIMGGVQRAWPIDAGAGEPPAEYSLFPGEYGFKLGSAERILERRIVRLEAGETAGLTSGPNPKASVRLQLGGFVTEETVASLVIRSANTVQVDQELTLTGDGNQDLILSLKNGSYELRIGSEDQVVAVASFEVRSAEEVLTVRPTSPK